MPEIEIPVSEVSATVRFGLRRFSKSADLPLFLADDDAFVQALIDDCCLGAVDFLVDAFPPAETEPARRGSYPVRLTPTYHITLSKSSWDIFKASVGVVAAFACLASGQVTLGLLSSVVSARELVKTLVSSLHTLDTAERNVVEYILAFCAKYQNWPTCDYVTCNLPTVEGHPARCEVATTIDRLVDRGILNIKDETAKTIQIAL